MATDKKFESCNNCDLLSEIELDGVVAGATDLKKFWEALSVIMKGNSEVMKALTSNIR